MFFTWKRTLIGPRPLDRCYYCLCSTALGAVAWTVCVTGCVVFDNTAASIWNRWIRDELVPMSLTSPLISRRLIIFFFFLLRYYSVIITLEDATIWLQEMKYLSRQRTTFTIGPGEGASLDFFQCVLFMFYVSDHFTYFNSHRKITTWKPTHFFFAKMIIFGRSWNKHQHLKLNIQLSYNTSNNQVNYTYIYKYIQKMSFAA